jgi:hypothetical protein
MAVCCAVLCCAVLCCAVLCCAVLCCAVLCCAVLCCAVLCCAVLCPRYMKVPGVSARFGTDPFIWNWAMWLVARLCPRQFLQDRSQVGMRVVFRSSAHTVSTTMTCCTRLALLACPLPHVYQLVAPKTPGCLQRCLYCAVWLGQGSPACPRQAQIWVMASLSAWP